MFQKKNPPKLRAIIPRQQNTARFSGRIILEHKFTKLIQAAKIIVVDSFFWDLHQ